eukprot:1623763-Prymnesium_polylepis.1
MGGAGSNVTKELTARGAARAALRNWSLPWVRSEQRASSLSRSRPHSSNGIVASTPSTRDAPPASAASCGTCRRAHTPWVERVGGRRVCGRRVCGRRVCGRR